MAMSPEVPLDKTRNPRHSRIENIVQDSRKTMARAFWKRSRTSTVQRKLMRKKWYHLYHPTVEEYTNIATGVEEYRRNLTAIWSFTYKTSNRKLEMVAYEGHIPI